MADMANLAKVERAWRELGEVLDPDAAVTPITYINSAADLKAFCGEHGGIVCTSTNARKSCNGRSAGAKRCCSFRSASGRWTGYLMDIRSPRCWYGIPTNRWWSHAAADQDGKVLLWKGHCSVHQMFQAQHILRCGSSIRAAW